MNNTDVIIGSRAITSIHNEVSFHTDREIGGILLGHRVKNTWYVIENIDPGWNSISEQNHFEYDQDYVNYTANKIAMLYSNPLEMVGIWHSHISSNNTFSEMDFETNKCFCKLSDYGILSGIVNIVGKDNYLTMYYISKDLSTIKLTWSVSDSGIPSRFKYMCKGLFQQYETRNNKI